MGVLQERFGSQVLVVVLSVKSPKQEVHSVGLVLEHSLHGGLHLTTQVLLTGLNAGLHSMQVPLEHVRQLVGHALHEVMVLLVRTGSNPLPHLSH